jgi:drug/metabolite transporter (DMT)-like permease
MLFMVLASLCTSINLLIGKSMLGSMPFEWVVFLRFIIPFILLLWVAIVTGFPKRSEKESIGPMVVRCATFFLTQYLLFWYLEHGSFLIAAVLTCTTPIFVPILDKIFYKIPITFKMWMSVGFSFLGILLILRPGSDGFDAWAIIGLLSGFFSALGQISFNQVAKKQRPQDTAFYLFLIGSIFSFLLVIATSKNLDWVHILHLIQTGEATWIWLSFGLVTVLVQVFRSKSYACVIKTGSVLPLSYFTIIFSSIIAWVLFDQLFSLESVIGVFLVIFGGVILLHRKVEKGING